MVGMPALLAAGIAPETGQRASIPALKGEALRALWSDRQATDAVRSRLDWQYALSLELTDRSFGSTVLSEFRTRFVAGTAEQRLLDALLTTCRERQWLKARGRQRTDSTVGNLADRVGSM